MTTNRHLDQRLKVQHFRAVDAIAAHGSLLKAATALSLTQPALSKSVRDVEDILGVKLFERNARGVSPTAPGLAFIESARRLLAELRRLDETLDVLSSPGKGGIAIGVLPTAASGVLPGVLARIRTVEPEIRIRMEEGRTEDLLPLLAAAEIDLIVGRLYEPALPDAFEREALWTEPMSIVARVDHPIFRHANATIEHIGRYDLVLPTVTQRMGQEIEQLLHRLGIVPRTSYRSSSAGFIREMLHGGDFLSIMPRLMLVGDVLRGSLRLAPLPVASPERPAGLIRRADAPLTPSGGVFVEILRTYVADIARRGV
jgi:LysR family transcriptional regulator, pca operon transcriptional activator